MQPRFARQRPVYDAPHVFEAIAHMIILRAIKDETSNNGWYRAILIACEVAVETH